MNIEEAIFNDCLPCNTLAMINRMKELLDENDTNCLKACKDDVRVKQLMWLLNSQVYGQLSIIDMCKEWDTMYAEFNESKNEYAEPIKVQHV